MSATLMLAVALLAAPTVPVAPAGAPTDGVDARPVIQSMMDSAAPGTDVRLPAGTYLLGGPLRVPTGVRLCGEGADRTTLLLDRRAWDQFAFGFLVGPRTVAGRPSTDVVVCDLTVDGNRTNRDPGDGTPDGAANRGGGVKTGDRWSVRRVRFTNLNYFKVWVYHSTDVSILDSVFDADGGSSGDNDNVGGGRSSRVLVAGNRFAVSTRGNAVDLVRADTLTVTGNLVEGAPGQQHGIYLEGVTDSVVAANDIDFAGITVKPETGYALTDPVVNPSGVTVRDNRVRSAPSAGIAIAYGTSVNGFVPGGGNLVSGNEVTDAGRTGIALIGCTNAAKALADTVTGNLVVNPFTVSPAGWGTGCGTLDPSGIGATLGVGDRYSDNVIRDTRPSPRIWWGIALRPSGTPPGVSEPAVTGTVADQVLVSPVQLPA